jgi:hypothetical protein
MTEPTDDRYPDDERLRRYLLGDLSEDEAAGIETAYFADPDLLARIEVAEHDLLDEYASDRMASADRAKLERTVLGTPDGRKELALVRSFRAAGRAEAIRDAVDRHPSRGYRWRWLAAAATVVLALAGVSIVWLQREDSERPSQTTAVTPAPPPPAVAPPVASTVVATLVLTRDLSRSEGRPPTVAASPEITHLDLLVPEQIPDAVSARVETVEGQRVWSGVIDRVPDGRSRVRVPATALRAGDYILVLIGKDGTPPDAAQAFYFRVRAQ